jgi:hypothetical protein
MNKTMTKFRVVLIPNSRLDEEDSADFKEWRDVEYRSAMEAVNELEKDYLVIKINRLKNE